MVMMRSNEDTISLVPCGFFISLICLDHIPVDPAIALINSTGHQLVTLCRSICAEEREREHKFWIRSWRVSILIGIS